MLYELGRISKSFGAHFELDGEWITDHDVLPRWRIRRIGPHVLEAICPPYRLIIHAFSHIVVYKDDWPLGYFRYICALGIGCRSASDIFLAYLTSVGYYLAPTLHTL